MTTFLEISTWAWIVGVFIVIKCIFKYLTWLYHDKDKTLRDAVRLTWDYLSQHTYFEVAQGCTSKIVQPPRRHISKKDTVLVSFPLLSVAKCGLPLPGKMTFLLQFTFCPCFMYICYWYALMPNTIGGLPASCAPMSGAAPL